MDRFVVLVDAGYLFSQSVKVLSAGKSRSRADLKLVDANGLIQMLVGKASTVLDNKNLLRVYWYDGIKNGPSHDHHAIVNVDDVQLRAGTINGQGQQKGVDSKIVIDLIELATNHAISDALLITGDGDLAIGIELSQRRGIRVAVLGVEDIAAGVTHGQSPEVTNVADRVISIGSADLSPFVSYVPKVLPAVSTVPAQSVKPSVSAAQTSATVQTPITHPVAVKLSTAIGDTVRDFVTTYTPVLSASVISSTGTIGRDIDKALLHHVFVKIGRALTDDEKRSARAELRLLLKTR